MHFTSQTVYAILGAGAFLAVIANTIASVILARSSNTRNVNKDASAALTFKDQRIAGLEDKVKDLEANDIQKGKEIFLLQADNKRLETLNANRNPELETLMTKVLEALTHQTTAINALLQAPSTTTIINK